MPEVDLLNPLTPEQKTEINEGIKSADETLKAIDKAIGAGIDTGEERERTLANREKLIKLRRTYFPNE